MYDSTTVAVGLGVHAQPVSVSDRRLGTGEEGARHDEKRPHRHGPTLGDRAGEHSRFDAPWTGVKLGHR